MRIVSVARSTGGMEALIPVGCSNFADIPADLMLVIDHSLRILNWQENLMDDEMPPKWMWHLDSELETHFAVIKEKRKSPSSPRSSDDTPDDWEENAYAARFKD